MKEYLKHIRKYPHLTDTEEVQLFKDYYKGDLRAFDKLVEANLQNAFNIAHNFYKRNSCIELDEMVGSANETLVNCVKQFDISKGYRFYSYLSQAIHNTLVKLINIHKNVPLPQNKYHLFGKIETGYKEGFTKKEQREYDLFANYLYVRFSDGDQEEHDFDVIDAHEENKIKSVELKDDINLYLNCLTPKEQYVVNQFFGIDMVKSSLLQEIADDLGVSKTRASQIKKKAIEKIQLSFSGL